MARAAGSGREDYTSLLKVLEKMAGAEVSKSSRPNPNHAVPDVTLIGIGPRGG